MFNILVYLKCIWNSTDPTQEESSLLLIINMSIFDITTLKVDVSVGTNVFVCLCACVQTTRTTYHINATPLLVYPDR